MRLTAELVRQSPVTFNPVYERELSLRGFKIPAIENLSASQDEFEAVDFSDNEIMKLENFPVLRRLSSLYLNNNRIRHIARGLGRALPRLQTLVLTNNQLARLEDLNALQDLPSLQYLSLVKNPVSGHQNYRLYVISLLPKLRHLDFQKVHPKEREQAEVMFGEHVKALKANAPIPSASDKAGGEEGAASGMMTMEQKRIIMTAIQNAQSLDEINRLERMLQEGRVRPSDLASLTGDSNAMSIG